MTEQASTIRVFADTASREQEITGKPQRIETPDRQEVADEVQAATARIRRDIVGNAAPVPLEAIPEIMFTLCRFPAWDNVMAMALQIQGPGAALPARDRQLVILRTAWLLQAPFEWGEHVRMSKKVGLSADDVLMVIEGPDATGLSPHEQALLRSADELRSDAMVSDETWEKLSETFNDQQMFELLVLVGHFTNVAYFQNSLRLRLEPGNEGLAAR